MKKKDPRIWCIVPFSRPQYLPDIFKRFSAQTYQNKKLIIVENGNGLGACKHYNLYPDVLLSSDPHQAWAKNEGLLYLKRIGADNDYWTTWDDDDYYSSLALQELADNVHKGDVIGKSKSFVKLTDNNLYLIDLPPENALLLNNVDLMGNPRFVVHGPTITAKVGTSLLFEYHEFTEDLIFTKQMLEQGADIYVTSKYNWCYMRNAGAKHAWKISDDEFKFANSGTLIDFGPIDFDIVNGSKKPEGKIVYCNSISLHDSFSYKETMMQTGGTPDEVLTRMAKQLGLL